MNKYRLYIPFVLGAAIILAFWGYIEGPTLATVPNGQLIRVIGDLFGLFATYSALWQLVLMSRMPFLERGIGREVLTKFHKLNGYAVLILIITHAILVTTGFALLSSVSYITQYINQFNNFQDVWKANIALALFLLIVGMSISIVRRRLNYESWYYVHLTTYLAIVLAFSHQLSIGPDFLAAPAFRIYWIALYVIAFGSILIYRFIRPVWYVYRYDLRVKSVKEVANNIYAITMSGKNLKGFTFEAGQFAVWRFLAPGLWWQAHPFSFSQEPNGDTLRITVKGIGNFTKQIQQLEVGTRVILDGPSGKFTLHGRTADKYVFIAGGIGITPLRSLLATVPQKTITTLIYSVTNEEDIAFNDELKELAKADNITVTYVISSRDGRITAAKLKAIAPDIKQSVVFLCGPPVMMDATTDLLHELDVPSDQIVTEDFRY